MIFDQKNLSFREFNQIKNDMNDKTTGKDYVGSDDRKRDIKDLGAAAVLVCAIAAAVVGIIIFIPKIIALCC